MCGTKIDLTFAVDMSIGNQWLHKDTKRSLHQVNPETGSNIYTQIIESISKEFEKFSIANSHISVLSYGSTPLNNLFQQMDSKTNKQKAEQLPTKGPGAKEAIKAYLKGLKG